MGAPVSERPSFAIVPIAALRAHESTEPAKVRALAEALRRSGVFEEPIWVAAGSNVILNGHHRAAALARLGADRVPAWRIDYGSDAVALDRWSPGPPVSKAEVLRRAFSGELFPPRTTRHMLAFALPAHGTPLVELGVRVGVGRRAPQRGAVPAARSGEYGSASSPRAKRSSVR